MNIGLDLAKLGRSLPFGRLEAERPKFDGRGRRVLQWRISLRSFRAAKRAANPSYDLRRRSLTRKFSQ